MTPTEYAPLMGAAEYKLDVFPPTERWDGVRWTNAPNELLPSMKFAYLTSVAAVDPHYAWAIGEGDGYTYTNHISFIEKWNGTIWQQLPSPRVLWA